MSLDVLMNRMRLEAARDRTTVATTRVGIITSYDDTGGFAVNVQLQPDGTETGWIPLGSPMIGNGWGVFFAPNIGDQVVVEFQEGGHEVPIATVRLFDDQNRALAVPAGEMWLIHKSGAYIKLTTDGKIAFNSTVEIDAGNMGSALLTLATSALKSVFNGHTHPVSGDVTGQPSQQLTDEHFTSILKAN